MPFIFNRSDQRNKKRSTMKLPSTSKRTTTFFLLICISFSMFINVQALNSLSFVRVPANVLNRNRLSQNPRITSHHSSFAFTRNIGKEKLSYEARASRSRMKMARSLKNLLPPLKFFHGWYNEVEPIAQKNTYNDSFDTDM